MADAIRPMNHRTGSNSGKAETNSSTGRPLATLSLDLDNHWAYLRGHNAEGWETFPSYLELVVPRILEFLSNRSLTITFFLVGQDAAIEKHQKVLSSIAAAGHEIANHSFGHEAGLHLYSEQQIKAELDQAEIHIERATGYKPVGFRGPAYCLSNVALAELARRGYRYDASTLPTFLGPLARAYYFAKVGMSSDDRRKRRKMLGGGISEGFRPLKPYRWRTEHGELLEIPVTTMPVIRSPIHVTYLQWLGRFSPWLARTYFQMALKLCRLTKTSPSLLLHPTDFLGADDPLSPSFLPAMDVSREKKLNLLSQVVGDLSDEFDILTLRGFAEQLEQSSNVPVMVPDFNTT